MLICTFYEPLADGTLVSDRDILNLFDIYKYQNKADIYILVPRTGQRRMGKIVIIATNVGIRIIQPNGWPRELASKLRNLIRNKQFLSLVDVDAVPYHSQEVICGALRKVIKSGSK